jgi:DNA-binding response OmpR family regulator
MMGAFARRTDQRREGKMDPVARIVVAEDDSNIASLIVSYLEREGYEVAVAHDGIRALELAERLHPDLVVLDLMLPELDGWEVCKRLRQTTDTPILMLTARGEEHDRILGFALGADDYVVKPFSPGELVLRVKAILRRAASASPPHDPVLKRGGLLLDPERHRVVLGDRPIALTETEFRLLQLLMSRPGRVFSRGALLEQIKPSQVVVDRTIDVHIGNLRSKLGNASERQRFIETVRGVGYRFREESP